MKKNTKIALISCALLLMIVILLFNVNSEKNSLLTIIYSILYMALVLLYLLKENKKIISIKSLYLLMYSLMFGLSPLFYVLRNKSYYINGESILYQYPISIVGLITLLLSYYLPSIKINNHEVEKNENTKNNALNFQAFFAITIIIISTIANIIYIYKSRYFLFSSNLEVGRIEALAGNGIMILVSGFNVIGTAMLFDYYINTNKKKYLLLVSVIIFIIIYIIRGARTPILRLLVIMVLVYNSKKKISIKNTILLIILSLLVLSFLQVIRTMSSGGQTSIIASLLDNLQVGTINFNYIYKTFPEKIPFQKGYSFLINLKMLLPGEDPDFTLWLKDLIGISFSGGGITPTILGEGYLNYGFIGSILEIFFIGLIGRKLDLKYSIANKSKFWYIYVAIIMIDAFRGGLANIEVSLLSILIVYITYYIMTNMHKTNN